MNPDGLQTMGTMYRGRPESANHGWPARWPTKLAAMDSLPSIKGWRNCSANWPSRADGSIGSLLGKLVRTDVLVLDDFAMAPMKDSERRDSLEVCDERYQRRPTILTSQMPMAHWHEQIGDPSLADSILDRLVHLRPRLQLKRPNGWFAAGPEVRRAATALSDASFKVFVWLCLHAERASGRLLVTAAALAQALSKSEAEIIQCFEELVHAGVCHRSQRAAFEIQDRF